MDSHLAAARTAFRQALANPQLPHGGPHAPRQVDGAKVVSERLGHASVGITLDTYSHLLAGPQLAAAAHLDVTLDEPAEVLTNAR